VAQPPRVFFAPPAQDNPGSRFTGERKPPIFWQAHLFWWNFRVFSKQFFPPVVSCEKQVNVQSGTPGITQVSSPSIRSETFVSIDFPRFFGIITVSVAEVSVAENSFV